MENILAGRMFLAWIASNERTNCERLMRLRLWWGREKSDYWGSWNLVYGVKLFAHARAHLCVCVCVCAFGRVMQWNAKLCIELWSLPTGGSGHNTYQPRYSHQGTQSAHYNLPPLSHFSSLCRVLFLFFRNIICVQCGPPYSSCSLMSVFPCKLEFHSSIFCFVFRFNRRCNEIILQRVSYTAQP
jgi:hypothetical protein